MQRKMTVSRFVRYVGERPAKVDNVAGTGLVWSPGQVHEVPTVAAEKMLQYKDVWVEEVPPETQEVAPAPGVRLSITPLSKEGVESIISHLAIDSLSQWLDEEVNNKNRKSVLMALQKEIARRESA